MLRLPYKPWPSVVMVVNCPPVSMQNTQLSGWLVGAMTATIDCGRNAGEHIKLPEHMYSGPIAKTWRRLVNDYFRATIAIKVRCGEKW